MGRQELMVRVKTLRTFLGNMISPNTAWLLLRSLETLKLRMDKQCENAQGLINHPKDYDLINLGEGINSEFADYNPCLTLDENTPHEV